MNPTKIREVVRSLHLPRLHCNICGQFISDTDIYGDFHMSLRHPVEYEAQMDRYRQSQEFRRRQAAMQRGEGDF